jgi:Bacterial membrane protein YfhO
MAKPKNTKKEASAKSPLLKKDTVRDFTFTLIPEKYQTPAFLGIILILILIFFNSGLFGGKVFSSADNIASGSFNTYLDDAKKDGIFPLWVPYIFCGMPSFAALIPHLERMYDYSQALWVILRDGLYLIFPNNNVWAIVLFYIIFGFAFYFLADYKFKNKLIALYCAVAAVFITPIIQMIIVGHNSKMIAVMMFPVIFLFILKIYENFAGEEKKNVFKLLLYFVLLTFFIHVQMSSNHIQMLFYFNLLYGFYLLYVLIAYIIRKTGTAPILKTIAVFVAATGLSATMNADHYMSTREYSKYSTRGVPAIVNQSQEQKNTSKDSDYEYATNWSFSPGEVMTLFIPSWQGFGDIEYQGQRLNAYWGQMPFTTSPMYFGVLTMLLAFIGIYYNFRKNILVQSLAVVSFIALILSFGRTFPVLYDILYYNLPYFSSFRAPVMIHIIINVAFVMLAGFGIKSIIETAKDKNATVRFTKNAKYVFSILFLPILFSIIGFEGYYSDSVSASPLAQKLHAQGYPSQQISQYLQQVEQIAYSNVKSEMLLIGFILLLMYGLIYLFIKGKVKYRLFFAGLMILILFDLWYIDFKTLHWDNKTDIESVFKAPDYVDWILKNEKNTNYFRVLNINKSQPVRENTLAYWRLENIYGYQGAKLRIYQDMDDVDGLFNPTVWNITSTKYIISDQPYADSNLVQVFKGSKYVLKVKDFSPKAYFVKSYKTASGIDILNNVKDNNFNPHETAFFEKDPGLKIDPPDSSANVKITSFGIHDISLEAEASGNNLMYLSEVYYPAGWKAFIDGNTTDIYKTNYLFRSIVVPKGKHKIEFKFEPEIFYIGKKIAIGSNIVLILAFIASIGGLALQRKKQEETEKTDNH